MAIKDKKEGQERSRLMEVLQSESKVWNYFILVLSIALIILAVFLFNGTLEIKSTIPIIGSFPKTFTWIIMVIGVVSLVYAIFPFAQSAFPELKNVTWPTKKLFLINCLKVFSFLVVFTLLYLMYDILVSELISNILKIK